MLHDPNENLNLIASKHANPIRVYINRKVKKSRKLIARDCGRVIIFLGESMFSYFVHLVGRAEKFKNSVLEMPVHTYNVAMTCGGCSGAVTRILTKQLIDGEKFDVS